MRLIATANEIQRVEREDSPRFIFRPKGGNRVLAVGISRIVSSIRGQRRKTFYF